MSAAPASPEAPGRRELGGYVLLERVSEGAFAEVWRAERSTRSYAIKIARNETGARMLRAEAGMEARVRGCPGILPLTSFEDGERPWLVLPWMSRGTLRDAMRDEARGVVVRRFGAVVGTVSALHARGIAHGDLKPENVFRPGAIGEDDPRVSGRRQEALLGDLGLARELCARRLEGSLSHSLSSSGLEGGTLAYLPPEAVKGAEPSFAGDVYALGVMLHEILVGWRPDKAVSAEDLRRLLDAEVVEVLRRALAWSPEDRYRDARWLSEALVPLMPKLAATGVGQAWHGARRVVLTGLAAFFVALRYCTVAALLACYATLLFCAVAVTPWLLIAFVPIGILHLFVRWEGPETQAEAAARRRGTVVAAPAEKQLPRGLRGWICPSCRTPLPMIRIPKSLRDMLWGGWTCTCGCKIDRKGRKIEGQATRT